MQKQTQYFHVENGYVYCEQGNFLIEKPAILIDAETGTVHKYGEHEIVAAYAADAAKRAPALTQSFSVIGLDGLTPEQQCYVLRRCVEYGASEFTKKLTEHAKNGNTAWLKSEMQRVPL